MGRGTLREMREISARPRAMSISLDGGTLRREGLGGGTLRGVHLGGYT